ncbi:unnamed protein product, partial [Ceratitis capitata]
QSPIGNLKRKLVSKHVPSAPAPKLTDVLANSAFSSYRIPAHTDNIGVELKIGVGVRVAFHSFVLDDDVTILVGSTAGGGAGGGVGVTQLWQSATRRCKRALVERVMPTWV